METTLADVATPKRERVAPDEHPDLPFVGMEHVEAHTMKVLGTVPASSMRSSAMLFEPTDVIYGRLRPYLNKVAQPGFRGMASAEFIVLPDQACLRSPYLKYRLNASDFVTFASNLDAGDRPRVDFEQIGRFEFWLPPEPEQRCIVAKIEELFSDLDAGVVALERVRDNLKRYRAAVLKAAVEGKLTEDWRAQHPDTKPACVLLERILTERRRRWEKHQLAKFAQAGKKLPKGWQDGYREPSFPDESRLHKIPSSWTWVTCEALLSSFSSGSTAVPVDVPTQYPILRSSSVRAGRIDLQDARYLTSPDANLLANGDILFVRLSGTVDYVACCAIVRNLDASPIAYPDRLFRAKPVLSSLAGYIEACFSSPICRERIRDIAKSSAGHQRISSDGVTGQPVPLPPLAEMVFIVEELERRLSIVDEIEAQIDANLMRAARLRQGILKRAFEGRLVPQDPTDEPAEMLLERIRRGRHPCVSSSNESPQTPHSGQGSARRRSQSLLRGLDLEGRE